ncbi:LysR family transcriptional regulator [Paenibacillus chitinolyticus]|uniref:LysR family transcriptional regulator n=1 Tax=Paenibacillus chitinolyticus TaxID=79263 RepID=UPI002DB90FDF|nr:LysR family transcriptional regulator [Paenibacillus chitinolyticus]MEC0248545.1 LysR family transcriptional regulator [Paenibacillus chitinolyticus]
MDFKTLKSFEKIVEHGNFARAAEELAYSPSTVTTQIQKLESDLGVLLFERGKKIALTEAGRLFYEQSIPILKNMEQLQKTLGDLASGEAGHVRMGVTEPTASHQFPGLLRRFTEVYPHIRISVEIAGTPVLTDKILKGELDFGLGSFPDSAAQLHFEPLFTEEFLLLVPKDHALAREGSNSVTLGRLRETRLLITAQSCPYRRKLETALREEGSFPPDTMEIGSMSALKHYVAEGLGAALVPRMVLDPLPEGTLALPMEGGGINMTCGLICRSADLPLKRAGKNLYDFLLHEFTRQKG